MNENCPFEASVADAARSGEWSPELEAHRNGCMTCAEVTLVAAALGTDAEDLAGMDTPLPDPRAIWLRSQLASRERDYRRATSAIIWVQRAAVAVALAIGMAFAPGLWVLVKRVFSSIDVALPVAELPRAMGSPLLVVVVSMMVLGVLAFMEFTSANEG